ncbi:MAG: VWA domain-containing protein [Chitinophagaceae bacterium]|nr:VWA domain-containing protein [Chitinophagaceae bacterium]
MKNELENWFSFHWFSPDVLMGFDWEYKMALYLIWLIPLLFLIQQIIYWKHTIKLSIALTQDSLRSDYVSFLRFLPNLIISITLLMLILALARPQKTNEKIEQWSEGIDIILTLDISESMQIQDFLPNRLEAAKKVATNFISGRFQDRIGLVIFSGEAFSKMPLTTDYKLLNTSIKDIDFTQIESRGTAIGSALAVSTNRMLESKAKSKIIILLSDGDNTAGNIDPMISADLANAYGIKVYTIAIGKNGRVPFGVDAFGNTRYVENTLDETTLRNIAEKCQGRFYRASDNEALEKIFSEIDILEKDEIKVTQFKDTTDFYIIYLKWGLLFFLLWLFLKGTFINNILKD